MRDSLPPWSNKSCAAPKSITTKGAPLALTRPAISMVGSAKPDCRRIWDGVAPASALAAALRKPVLGAKMANRFVLLSASPGATGARSGSGIKSGATGATSKASIPITRTAVRLPVVGCARYVLISSTGEAWAIWGKGYTRAYTPSSKLPCAARSERSGSPFTERTACENSSSAEALIKCTANASATPSVTASTAAALRHGWWRSSAQE